MTKDARRINYEKVWCIIFLGLLLRLPWYRKEGDNCGYLEENTRVPRNHSFTTTRNKLLQRVNIPLFWIRSISTTDLSPFNPFPGACNIFRLTFFKLLQSVFRIRFILIRIRIRILGSVSDDYGSGSDNFNSVNLVFPIKCFAMFFFSYKLYLLYNPKCNKK